MVTWTDDITINTGAGECVRVWNQGPDKISLVSIHHDEIMTDGCVVTMGPSSIELLVADLSARLARMKSAETSK